MKLFITDYDDTLFIGEKEIRKTVKLLKKLHKKEYYIVISTGRSYPSIKKQTIMYDIPYDYISCADGSIIYDKNGNIINAIYMNKKIIKPLMDFYQNIDFEEIQFSYPEGYSNIYDDKNDKLLGINICISTVKYSKELVNNFMELSKKYPEYNYLDYKHPNFSYLCVKPKGISKSYAVSILMEKNNVLKGNVRVIGDSSNDYEMIKDYDGVCVLNACPEVLSIAKKKYKVIDDYIYELLKED